MPLYLVEHSIIAFDPNGPESNPSKEVPNFNLFAIPFRNSLPEQGLFLVETIIVTRPNSTKLMHNEYGPSPCPSCLDANPKFNRFASIREAKNTLFRDKGRSDAGPSFVDGYRLVKTCLIFVVKVDKFAGGKLNKLGGGMWL